MLDTGAALLMNSEPSLYEFDEFDGPFLDDNINRKKDVPKEMGVYKCDILMDYFSYSTDCGTEYDRNSWLENVEKVELPL